MLRLDKTLLTLWSLAWGLVWVLVLHPLWRRTSSGQGGWVIGGHRGRLYGDNAAAVEAEARRQGKDVIWIANRDLAARLRTAGLHVLVRQSWAARRAISSASTLIYSHGEDDLDLQLILLRGRTATRVYLDHCLCLLKGGGQTEPTWKSALPFVRAFRSWLMTRWDYVLCASDEELRNFKDCYPMNPFEGGAARTDGGAHLDEWTPGLREAPLRRLYWFPTFRDSPTGKNLLRQTIKDVTSSEPLRTWLIENDYELYVGAHVNDGAPADPLQAPFFRADLNALATEIRQSEVLISDYSGVVFDFLILERPLILFAFDLDDYQKRRHLFDDYDSLDFAVHARSTDQLVNAILNKAWQAPELTLAARKRRALSLPAAAESYAARSVRAIEEIENQVVTGG